MDKQVDPNAVVSFGILADLQYCNAPPLKNRHFKNAPEKLLQAISEFNKHPLDFVVNLGDTIDRDWTSFDEILPVFNHLNFPLYHVLGNHDYEVEDQYKSMVHGKSGNQKNYDFSIRNWRFIVLDGNEISTYANLPGEANHRKANDWLMRPKVNSNFWNGGIGMEQLSWLERKLEKATEIHENVILFCHFPLYPSHRHNLLNDDEVLQSIIKFDCIKVWFNGHNHDGNYGLYNDIHFVNLKGMVETEFQVAYSIVNLSGDNLIIQGFGNEISAKLNIQ